MDFIFVHRTLYLRRILSLALEIMQIVPPFTFAKIAKETKLSKIRRFSYDKEKFIVVFLYLHYHFQHWETSASGLLQMKSNTGEATSTSTLQ